MSLSRPIFWLSTVAVATGCWTLFELTGPTPSPQLTLLLVLISAGLVTVAERVWRHLSAWWERRRVPQTQTMVNIEEEGDAHEEDTVY